MNEGEKRRAYVRRIFLILHNCWLNGMANIYLHNNLEIFSKTNHGHDENEREKSVFDEESLSNSDMDLDIQNYSRSDIKLPASLGVSGVDSIKEEDEGMVIQEDLKTNDLESKHEKVNTNDNDEHPIEKMSCAQKKSKSKTEHR